MALLSNAAALEVECMFRIVQAKKTTTNLAEHRLLTIKEMNLIRCSVEKRNVTTCVNCKMCTAMAETRREEAIISSLYHEEEEEPLWQACCKVMSLVGVVTAILCLLIDNTLIKTVINSHSQISSQISSHISRGSSSNALFGVQIQPQIQIQPQAQRVLEIGVLRSDGMDESSMRIRQNNNNNNNDILGDMFTKEAKHLTAENEIHLGEEVLLSIRNDNLTSFNASSLKYSF